MSMGPFFLRLDGLFWRLFLQSLQYLFFLARSRVLSTCSLLFWASDGRASSRCYLSLPLAELIKRTSRNPERRVGRPGYLSCPVRMSAGSRYEKNSQFMLPYLIMWGVFWYWLYWTQQRVS